MGPEPPVEQTELYAKLTISGGGSGEASIHPKGHGLASCRVVRVPCQA